MGPYTRFLPIRTVLPIMGVLLPFQATAEGISENEAATHKALYQESISSGPFQLLAHASINHQDKTFIFDTGSEYTLLIDNGIAPALGKEIKKAGSTPDEEGVYALPEVKIGALSLPPLERQGIAMKTLQKATGIRLDGILGWKALSGNTLLLDHDHHRYEIIRGDSRLSPDASSVPIIEEKERPYVDWTIGDSSVRLLIDTGSNGGLSLNDENYDRLVQQEIIRPSGETQKVLKTTGTHAIRSGSFLKGSLLGVDLQGFPVNTNPKAENIMGGLFLMKLNASLSSSALRLDYQARRNPEAPVSTDLMLGIIFTYQDDGPTILRLKGGASGQVAGLEVGDVVSSVTEIGDRPINANTLNELCREKAGQTIHLKIRRNGSTLEKEMKLPAAISAWN